MRNYVALAAIAGMLVACGGMEIDNLEQAGKFQPIEGDYAVDRYIITGVTKDTCALGWEEGGWEEVDAWDRLTMTSDKTYLMESWVNDPVFGPLPILSFPCTLTGQSYTCDFPDQVVDFYPWSGFDMVMTIDGGKMFGAWTSNSSFIVHGNGAGITCDGADCDMLWMFMGPDFAAPCGFKDPFQHTFKLK